MNQCFQTNTIEVDIPDEIEIFWLHIRPNRLPRTVSSIIVGALYFPDENQDIMLLMLNHIQDTLDLMRVQYPDAGICIMGDMNKLDVSQLCRNNNLVQVVDKPTRGNSILDKIVTNFAQFYSTPLIETPIGMSDHSTVAWFPKSNHSIKHTNATITKTVRPIKDSGIRSFGSWISSHDWREVYEQNNSQDCTNAFYNTLNEQMDLHFPTRQVKHHVTDKPWISSKTKDLIKRRQEVFNHSRPPIWRFYRNKVQRSIANDKKKLLP